jgi:hypothetical protein
MLNVRIFNRLKKAHEDRVIYTQAEADELGIKYKPWIECEEGEYGLSDDGYATELITKKNYKDARHGYWSFTGGLVKRYANDYKKGNSTEELLVGPLLTGERKAKKIADALKTDKAKQIMRAYLLNDRKIDIAVRQILPGAPMIELNKWRTVAKSEEFKRLVKEEILNLLEACGYSKQKTILLLDEAIQMARDKKDVSNMMRAVENLFDILGFRDKDVKKDSIEFRSDQIEQLANSVLESKQQIKLVRETPLEVETGDPTFNIHNE